MDTYATSRRPRHRRDHGKSSDDSSTNIHSYESELRREYYNDSQPTPEQGEIQDLLRKILRNGQDPDRKQVENILLVGLSGAGKSALMCTLNAALTGRYNQWSSQGHGHKSTNTTTLTRFETCGVRQYDVQGNENESLLRDIQPTLPHIWDFIGLANQNVHDLREMLYLVVHGYIPPDTDFTSLQEMQTEHKEDQDVLRMIFRTQNPDWIITKIVFVHGCNVVVPFNLIDCLMSVVNETDPRTATRCYRGDLFVVMTKQDLAARQFSDNDSIEVINTTSADEQESILPDDSPSPDHVDGDIEAQIAAKFNILGSLEYSRVRLTNYSDATGFDYNPDIVKQHLKFLHLVTMPKLRKSKPNVVLTEEVQRLLFLRKVRRVVEENINMDVRIAFALLCLACLFLSILSSSPSK